MTLGHRVAVLNNGRLQQCGPPRELYERPVNMFVAGFIGSPAMNLCTVEVGNNGAASFGGIELSLPQSAAGERPDEPGARHAPRVAGGRDDGIPARVDVVEDVGADVFVFCSTEHDGDSTRLVARSEVRSAPKQGDRVSLRPRMEDTHLFDPATGERLVPS